MPRDLHLRGVNVDIAMRFFNHSSSSSSSMSVGRAPVPEAELAPMSRFMRFLSLGVRPESQYDTLCLASIDVSSMSNSTSSGETRLRFLIVGGIGGVEALCKRDTRSLLCKCTITVSRGFKHVVCAHIYHPSAMILPTLPALFSPPAPGYTHSSLSNTASHSLQAHRAALA